MPRDVAAVAAPTQPVDVPGTSNYGRGSPTDAAGTTERTYGKHFEDDCAARTAERPAAGHRRPARRPAGPGAGVRLRDRHELRLVLVLRQDRPADVPRQGGRPGTPAAPADGGART